MATEAHHATSLTTFDAGALSVFLPGFQKWLVDAGRLPTCVAARVHSGGHLGYWMKKQSIAPQFLDAARLTEFSNHLSSCRCPNSRPGKHHHTKLGAKQFARYLKQIEVVVDDVPAPPSMRQPPILLSFFSWMRRYRGVKEKTLVGYGYPVRDLITVAGNDPITVGVVRQFILERSARTSTAHMKNSVTAIRMFVRFLILESKCSSTVLDAIPKIANWRLASLPRYLSSSAIEKLLDTPTAIRVRLRSRAILLLLVRLGLRAGDVSDLQLKDIDWSQGASHGDRQEPTASLASSLPGSWRCNPCVYRKRAA